MLSRRRLSMLLAVAWGGLATAAPAQAAAPPVAPQVVNGSESADAAWPAQGLVSINGSTICGGTLISRRYVLTAAHCAGAAGVPPASAFRVRLGSNTYNSGGTYHFVDAVQRHSGYGDSPTPDNDLMLLHLSGAATQAPLPLITPLESSLWAPGVAATVIGWGQTASGGPVSTKLREAQVPMVTDASCATAWNPSPPQRPPFRPTTMVCAGAAATDACNGDSGGPLMVPRQGVLVLAGVVSWGAAQCATPGVPGVYVRVGAPALNQWIRDRIPTADVISSLAAPNADDTFTLTATATQPAAVGAPTAYAWDLDGDGGYDDATGEAASVTFAQGSHRVGVRTTYADGDGAFVDETLAVAAGGSGPQAQAPSNVVAPSITGAATIGQTLTAADGSWNGYPAPVLTRRWQRCDGDGAGCANITGQTGATYQPTTADAGRRLRIMVTATNSGGSPTRTSAPSAIVIVPATNGGSTPAGPTGGATSVAQPAVPPLTAGRAGDDLDEFVEMAASGLRAPTARMTLSGLRAGRLAFGYTCIRRCTVTARLTVDRATAKRLGLERRVLGSARTTRSQAATGRMAVRLTAKARRALRGRRSVKLTLHTRLVAGSESLSKATRITATR